MKSLLEVGAKHIHYMNRARRIVWRVMKKTSRKLTYIVSLAPTSKSDFMEKFSRLVVTKLDIYFIPFSAFICCI